MNTKIRIGRLLASLVILLTLLGVPTTKDGPSVIEGSKAVRIVDHARPSAPFRG